MTNGLENLMRRCDVRAFRNSVLPSSVLKISVLAFQFDSDRQPNARQNRSPGLQTGVQIGTLKNKGIQLETVESILVC